jgi:cell division protease FtsH
MAPQKPPSRFNPLGGGGSPRPGKTSRPGLSLWYGLALLLTLGVVQLYYMTPGGRLLPYSEFKTNVRNGNIAEVTIGDQSLHGTLKSGTGDDKQGLQFTTTRVEDPKLAEELDAKGVKYNGEAVNRWLPDLLGWILPVVFIVALWAFFFRRMGGAEGGVMSFARSRAKIYADDEVKVRFADVAGVDEAEEELKEIVEFLKTPKKYTNLGGRIPKGALLVGPPGTGKTLLARAVAGEAHVPFFSLSGSEFVEMFVGVGAARIRDLFQQAEAKAPCIVFIDELDALGKVRSQSPMGSHEEREQTLNQLLAEMDGFDSRKGVIIMAATNRPEVLDPALLRPGRFDRQILVDKPDVKGREAILRIHAKDVRMSPNIDLRVVAARTAGFAGADLANLVNEAALNAARFNKKKVEMIDFEYAKDKVMMGPERKSMIMTEDEKRNTAYHEGGHALVAAILPDADPVHKVTIIPRGRALGVTMQLPTEDKYSHTKEYLEATVTVMMGGRIAEEKFLGHMTTGAGNDIERATDLARKMVCEWGMSEMGPLTFGRPEQEIFLGRDFGRTQDYSESTANQIDAEVKRIVTTAYDRAQRIIEDNQKAMHRIARTLLEKEVLDGDEVLQIIAEESGTDVSKLRKTGPPKPPILPGTPTEVVDGTVGPLVPEPA